MQHHREQVDVSANLPAFVRIEMQIPGNRLRVCGIREIGMGQHLSRTIEWISVPMAPRSEKEIQVPRSRRIARERKGDTGCLGPFSQRPLDLPRNLFTVQLPGKSLKRIRERCRSLT